MAKKKPNQWNAADGLTLDDLERIGYQHTTPLEPTPAAAQDEPKAGFIRRIGDLAVSGVKGVIGAGEAAVGGADLVTGGHAGKFLEDTIGYRPQEARDFLDQNLMSDAALAEQRKFQQADGVVDKTVTALKNPWMLVNAVGESAPSMIGAGGIARGAMTALPRLGAVVASGLGEGLVQAGHSAEQSRQESPDKLLSGKQAGAAIASGAGDALITMLGGKIAKKLGIGDIDTLLAQGSVDANVRKHIVRATLEGAASEGLLEELPQSVQEQVWQNYASGKPLSDGVDDAAVMGALTGGLMGGGANVVSRKPHEQAAPIPELLPEHGPLSRAVNTGIKTTAATMAAQGIQPVGITPEQEAAAMGAMERLASDDQKQIKDAGRFDKTGLGGMQAKQGMQPEQSGQQAMPSVTISPDQPWGDRLLTIRDQFGDESVRQRVRDQFGDQALGYAMYYAQAADNPEIPEKTRERMLSLAERVIAAAHIQPIDVAGVGSEAPAKQAALPGSQQNPRLGMDTSPTGTMLADEQGNVRGETRVEKVSREQEARRKADIGLTPDVEAAQARMVRPGDITRPNGEPFKNRAAANIVQKKQGGAIVEVVGGFVVRQDTSATPTATMGTKMDIKAGPGTTAADVMQRFHPDTGTKGIPRAEMPQIKSEHHGALTNFLNARGIAHETSEVDPNALKPTQAEYSPEKVEKAKEAPTERSIIVSNDGHVLDGHHQWLAAKEKGEPVKAMVFDAPIDKLLGEAHQFPSTETANDQNQTAPASGTEAEGKTQQEAAAPASHAVEPAGRSAEPAPAEPARRADVQAAGISQREKAISAFKRAASAKHPGIDHQLSAERIADRLLPMIEEKNADAILSMNLGSADMNPGSRAAFESVTGVKLPKGRAASERAIDEWAGVTEHQRAEKNAAKKASIEAKNADSELRAAKRAASLVNVKDGERLVDGASWVDELIGKGFTKVVQRGPKTFLSNEQGIGWPMMHKDIAGYARKASKAQATTNETTKNSENDSNAASPAPGSRVYNPDGSYYTAPKANKAEMRPYRRPDGRVGYEAVPIVESAGQGQQDDIAADPEMAAYERGQTAQTRAQDREQLERGPYARWRDANFAERREMLRAAGYTDADQGRVLSGTDWSQLTDPVRKALSAKTAKSADRAITDNQDGQPPAPSKPAASANTIFTEDAAAKAREILRKKLWQLSSNIDPELLQAGLTLAGYHIEKGARTFAAYAKAMVDDLGETVKPYLQSWYMALRADPRAVEFKNEMQKASEVEDLDIEKVLQEHQPAESAPTIDPAARKSDTAEKQEKANDAPNVDRPGQGTLEGVPAGQVQSPSVVGNTETGADQRSPADGGRHAGSGKPGIRSESGVGDGARKVPVPTGGKRATGQRARDDGQRGLLDGDGHQSDAQQPQNAGREGRLDPPQFDPAKDFTITDDVDLGAGGQRTKYKANVDAIRLVKALDEVGRAATVEEQKVLAKYVGWGGLSQAFDEKNADWSKQHAELKELLTPEEWATAVESTQYAHYTSKEIVGGMYDALHHMGFNGGTTLEAGGGVGNFIGLMPTDMRTNGKVTLIEREAIASAIAKHLYPQQNIRRADFTEFGKGQDGQYDAQIGNPPFADTPLTDKSGRRHLTGLSVHNYFIAKGIDLLREGGVTAVVVSNSFMDAKNDRARSYIGDRATLLGAIRLPNNAFSKNAGTEVTTDIVFFKKLPESEWGSKAAKTDAKRWIGTENVADKAGGQDLPLNSYFASNPHMMLGDWGRYGSMYRADSPALVARAGQDMGAMLAKAIKNLPTNVYTPRAVANTEAMRAAGVEALHDQSVSEGGFYNHNGGLWRRLPDQAGQARSVQITPGTMWTAKQSLGQAGYDRISQLADMRQTVRALLAAEIADDSKMAELRKQLNQQYDAYVKEAGPINDRSTARLFEDDPDYPLLAALETDYEPGMGVAAARANGIKAYKAKANKAAIFSRRVVEARKSVTKAESPSDALNIAMAERGRLDADYIGKLLGKEPGKVLEELSSGDKPLLFKDPATGEYVLRDAYLSGNVRDKLLQARRAGMLANSRALEEVQPEDVPNSQISARIGSPWVPVSVYEDFAKHLFGDETKANITYTSLNSSFSGVIHGASDIAARTTFGTPAYTGPELLLSLLNNREIKVTYRDQEGKTHTDVKATESANEKASEIKEKFQDWLFKDADRGELLGRSYNDANNNYVTRQYDGSWLTFPGKVPDEIIKFRKHQRNAIARTIQDRTALYDHVVGAGKTFTAISAAMELKRTGLANKNMIAVPNHLVKQWAADFYRLYPGAKILTATKADFERANRRKFLAKIATGDWDAVIIAHSSFGFIKPDPDFEERFNEEQVANIEATIQAVENEASDEQQKKRTVKQLAKMKEKLENRIASLREKPMDDLLDLKQLGVDQLFVDEAHCFPAYTKVITDAGVLTIGEIVENRLQLKVLSVDSLTDALEWKQVTDWFKNSVTHFPVRIHHEGGAFECTANHNIWTYEEGFVEAGSLTGQHTICLAPVWAGLEAGGEALRDVRNGVQLQVVGEGEQRQEAVLLEPMRGELAHDAAAHQGRDHPWVTGWAEAGGGAPSREERPEIVGAHDGEQPDAQPGVESKNGVIAFREDVLISRREQQDHDAAIDAARGDGASNGVLYRNGAGQEYVQVSAELLQSGFGSTGQEDCHRGGWQDAQAETMEAAGCKEDGSSKRARVVCVEVLERGSDGQFAEGFRGDQSVYCLEVEDNHNFFADGVLVSNSFKNLMFSTKMQNVRGLGDSKGSKRAYDMYVKTRQIMDQNGRGQGVVFMTGTPVSNSLAEMYHMMRYLMPNQMKELGFDSFDAWANTYAQVNQVWMQKASGDGFKAQNRMSSFDNTTELLKLFDQVSDTVTMDDIKNAFKEENAGKEFPLPALKTGRRQPISLIKSPAQEEYMQEIAKRAAALEKKKGPPKKGDDNILVVMGDARKAAMDTRLVNPDATEREPGGRIDKAAGEIYDRWKKWGDHKGTQLVFSDMGTPLKSANKELAEYNDLRARIEPLVDEDLRASADLGDEAAAAKLHAAEEAQAELDAKGLDWLDAIKAALRGFSVYDDLKSALIERGIPAEQIAFIHDFNTDDQKAALFRKVNNGDIRVLIGSTPKMGAGTNVQRRMVALHHLDVPWKPSDLEQREGRIIRQGNMLADTLKDFEAEILAYVTQDTLDMRMWQIQETKLKMINQLRSRQIEREIENAFEDMEMSAGEMQAAATGNMDLLKEIQLRTDVQKLERKQRSFDARRSDLVSRRKRAERDMESAPKRIAQWQPWVDAWNAHSEATQEERPVDVTVNGERFTDRGTAGEKLRNLLDTHQQKLDARQAIIKANNGVALDEKQRADMIERRDAMVKAGNKEEADRLTGILNSVKDVPPMPKLAVDFNGKQYGSKTALAEAFTEATGDAQRFDWNFEGKDYIQRQKLYEAIADPVMQAVETRSIQPIGSFGPFNVSVEGGADRLGNKTIDVIVEHDGKTISTDMLLRGDSQAVANSAIEAAQRLVRNAESNVYYAKHDMEKAGRTLSELDKTEVADTWPEASKLEKARAAHKEVLHRLSASKNTEAAGEEETKFSRATEASHGSDVSSVKAIVSEITSKWQNAPDVVVIGSMSDAPESVQRDNDKALAMGADSNPSAFYSGGKVYLIASEMNGPQHVVETLLHEVLGHHGLQGAFGESLKPILQQLWVTRRRAVEAKCIEYGLDTNSKADRLIAAEEVLADMAQTDPRIGFVRRAVAAIRAWLRQHVPGFSKMTVTDDEIVSKYLVPARNWVERGGRQTPGNQATRYARSDAESNALSELSKNDELFALPKSDKTTVEGITKDNDPSIQVKQFTLPNGETVWVLTMPDGRDARITARKPNKYGPSPYGADFSGESYSWDTTRPGENPEYVDPEKVDVWLDVSNLTGKGQGATIYNIASTFAHNTGAVFIGDPSGVSADAMRRRPVHMLSSALKFGTTEHLAPHPEQTRGSKEFDIPALKWVYGDNLGNIRRLIDLNLKLLDNEFPASKNIQFDVNTGQFTDATTGQHLSRDAIGKAVTRERELAGSGAAKVLAGSATAARGSVLRSLLREAGSESAAGDGRRNDLLAQLVRVRAVHPQSTGGIFYSRTGGLNFADALGSINQQSIRDNLADFMGSAGAKVSWWEKSIGTQYAKAERHPEFKPVFDAVQQYVEDTSSLANGAADHAPNLLPKLNTWKDLTKGALSNADTAAIAAPIFEGTLTEQRVFDDDELRSRYKLNDRQIGLYKEFRETVNDSLDQVVAADVLRLLGDVPQGFKSLAVRNRGALQGMVDQFLTDQMEKTEDDGRREELQKLKAAIDEKYARAQELKDQGYAPLMRFGKFLVNVRDNQTGESLFFGLYENRMAANRMARTLAEDPEFKARGTIQQGVLSQEQHKLFAGVPLESMEMFAQAIGADQSEVFQQYLKLVKNNRSAMKRLIKRNGTAGFSQDVQRVLAAFVTSNARLTSGGLNMPQASKAAQEIKSGDVKDEAVKLIDTVQNPTETASAARSLLFMNFIGGSAASAIVNLTQPITMTAPYLSQWGGMRKAGARLIAAAKDAATGHVAEPELAKALKRAEVDGIVSPQEIHHLQAEAMGSWGTHPLMKKAAFIWGSMFSLAEQFNRRVTFIAAYRTAKEQGIENPFEFAEKAVVETQGLYNSGNKPNWARNPVGAAALTFKQFSTHYLEWFMRMWRSGPEGKKAAVYALAILMLAAGADGLPFADDLDDFIDTLAQAMGYDFSAKRAKQKFVAETLGLGDDAANVFSRGLSSIPGIPIDVSMRMSMGNLIPATGLFLKSNTDRSRDVMEVGGAAGALAKQYIDVGEKLLQGDVLGAGKTALPVALQSAAKGIDIWQTGEYRDTKDRRVMDADTLDGLMKAVGFQPATVAAESRKISIEQRRIDLAKAVETEIADKWAKGMMENDQDMIQAARDRLMQWNSDNPRTPIAIGRAQLIRRVREMKAGRTERFIKTAPKEIRGSVAEAIN